MIGRSQQIYSKPPYLKSQGLWNGCTNVYAISSSTLFHIGEQMCLYLYWLHCTSTDIIYNLWDLMILISFYFSSVRSTNA